MLRSYVGAKTGDDRHRVVGSAFLFALVTGISTVAPRIGVGGTGLPQYLANMPPHYLLIIFVIIISYVEMPRAYLRARG
jgi:ABC-type uncharacterized transport system permease subunit